MTTAAMRQEGSPEMGATQLFIFWNVTPEHQFRIISAASTARRNIVEPACSQQQPVCGRTISVLRMTICESKSSKTSLKGSKHEFNRKELGHVYFRETPSHRYTRDAVGAEGGVQRRSFGV